MRTRLFTRHIRTEFAWLSEQGLVTIEEIATVQIAKMTQRGIETALGIVVTPGVARSSGLGAEQWRNLKVVGGCRASERDEIERMWREGKFTLDELLEWIREKNPEAKFRAPGRTSSREVRRHFDRIREAKEVAATMHRKARGKSARRRRQNAD